MVCMKPFWHGPAASMVRWVIPSGMQGKEAGCKFRTRFIYSAHENTKQAGKSTKPQEN